MSCLFKRATEYAPGTKWGYDIDMLHIPYSGGPRPTMCSCKTCPSDSHVHVNNNWEWARWNRVLTQEAERRRRVQISHDNMTPMLHPSIHPSSF